MKLKNGLELRPIKLDENYTKAWNVTNKDFVAIFKDNKKVNDNLYRIGGMFNERNELGYIILLKYSEDYYSDSITKDKDEKKHLHGNQVIVDKNGIEKFINDNKGLTYLYLLDGLICTSNKEYFNIETNESYGKFNSSMESAKYYFLESKYSFRNEFVGVLRVNKLTGKTKKYI